MSNDFVPHTIWVPVRPRPPKRVVNNRPHKIPRRAAVFEFLQTHPDSTMADIIAGTGIAGPMLSDPLRRLLDTGTIIAEIKHSDLVHRPIKFYSVKENKHE